MENKETIFVKEKDGEIEYGHKMKYYKGPKTGNMWFKVIDTKQTEYGVGYVCLVPSPVPAAIVEKPIVRKGR